MIFKKEIIKNYFIKDTEVFYLENTQKRIKFLIKNRFFYNEISILLNKIISNKKSMLFFCCGNSIIKEEIKSQKTYIHEINEEAIKQFYNLENNNQTDDEKILREVDTIIIADLEYQRKPFENFSQLSKNIKDNCELIIISKSIIWTAIIKLFKYISKGQFPTTYNFLPFNYIKNIVDLNNLEIIRNEKAIVVPFKIPLITNLLNQVFRLPLLNIFCMINITVLKKKTTAKKLPSQSKISVIIPCKNEEKNIELIEKNIFNLGEKTEFIFGDDKSTDKTLEAINRINNTDSNISIKSYTGPGICKSENVYAGIDISEGDIVLIYDADCTVSFKDVKLSINALANSNSDIINCTRMIYPQAKFAMKNSNFIGNIFFAYLYSFLFNKKITDTLCGTKIFYKKDWDKLKNSNSLSGIQDLWGDFDLLIGAYKNNLKISEVPVHYLERSEGETKMKSVFINGLRMLFITIKSYYKLRIAR